LSCYFWRLGPFVCCTFLVLHWFWKSKIGYSLFSSFYSLPSHNYPRARCLPATRATCPIARPRPLCPQQTVVVVLSLCRLSCCKLRSLIEPLSVTMDASSDELRIAKHLLLSSPPGQFDLILQDLTELLSLSQDWTETTRQEHNSRTGREALDSFKTTQPENDALGLQDGMQQYIDQFYDSKGVTSNHTFSSPNEDGQVTILLYAERIQLQQYHAGSWMARYFINAHADRNTFTISGTIVLHAHTFENGNLQLKSTVDLPSVETNKSGIFQQIQKWDEASVMTLRGVYDDMPGEILKKLRRVMPVTRTRFVWNVEGHRGIRQLGVEVQNRE